MGKQNPDIVMVLKTVHRNRFCGKIKVHDHLRRVSGFAGRQTN